MGYERETQDRKQRKSIIQVSVSYVARIWKEMPNQKELRGSKIDTSPMISQRY